MKRELLFALKIMVAMAGITGAFMMGAQLNGVDEPYEVDPVIAALEYHSP